MNSSESQRSCRSLVAALLCGVLCVSGADFAASQEHDGRQEQAAESEHGHAGRFAVAGFIGATRDHGKNEPTLGIEAGVNLSARWSVGAVVERADRERDSTLVLFGVGWHPLGPAFRLQLGAGRKDPSGKREAVIRAGMAYEIEVHERWFVKPYLALDFIENAEDEEVFGVYVGRGFR